jgi:hypothetical protein
LDKESINAGVDTETSATEKAASADVFSRRGFIQRSGKALYLVPTLTLLGSATVSAQGSGCQPGFPGCDAAPGDALAPDEAPAPTE